MTTKRITRATLRDYARTYAADTWGIELRKITTAEVTVMEIRADGYANAHVEGEHNANGICSFESAAICGMWGAASEFVETTDGITVTAAPHDVTNPPRTGSHASHDHPSTKAARAACRRASATAIEGN